MSEETKTILIHHIIEGPFHSSDVDDPEGQYVGDFYLCLAKVEVDGQVSNDEVRFDSFDDFYEVKIHLDKHIEPYELEVEAFF